MTVNIPRVLADHATGALEEIDRDIAAAIDRLAQLVHQRTMIQTHLLVQTALSRSATLVVDP
jgi:hypothetical protein